MVKKLLILFALVFAGCRTTSTLVAPAPDVRKPADAQRWAESLVDDTHAAEVAWLMANDRAYARKRLTQNLKRQPHHAPSLLRRALLSEAELDAEGWLSDLLEIIEHAPQSNEAEAALVLLHDRPNRWASQNSRVARTLSTSGILNGPTDAPKVFLTTAILIDIARRNADSAGEKTAKSRGGWLTPFRGIGPLAPLDSGAFLEPTPYELEPHWKSGATYHGLPLPIRIVHTNGRHLSASLSGQPGLYVYDTSFEISRNAASGPLVLEAHLPLATRVRINGQTIIERTAQVRGPVLNRVHLVLRPGWHRLSLTMGVQPGRRPSLALSTLDGQPVVLNSRSGNLAPTAPTDDDPPTLPSPPDGVERMVERLVHTPQRGLFGRVLGARLASARWYGNPARADAYLAPTRVAAKESASVHWAWSRMFRRQDLGPLTQSAVQDALTHDPDLPVALVELAKRKSRDQPEASLALLDRAEALAPRAWAPKVLRFEVLKRQSWNAEAMRALSMAVEAGAPDAILLEGARFLRSLRKISAADALEDRALNMHARLRPARAAERALRRGQTDAAIDHLEAAAALSSPSTYYTRIAELYLTRSDPKAALTMLDRALSTDPFDTVTLARRIWAAALANDSAVLEDSWRTLRALGETNLDLEALVHRQRGTAFGPPAPNSWLGQTLSFDPWPHIRADDANRAPGLDPANRWAGHKNVLVLDRVVDQVLPSGQAISLRHAISRLQTKEATNQAGELDVPSTAYVLGLHTLKPDGRVIEVDRHAGKDDVSFSALAPGDAVERQWVEIDGAASASGGYLRRFYFRSTSPIIRSELAVAVPKGMQIWFQGYNGAPDPLVSQDADQTIYYWRAHDVAPIDPEPYSVPAEEYLPFVVITADFDHAQALAANHRGRGFGTQPSVWVDDAAQKILSEQTSPASDPVETLFRWVVKEIDHGPPANPTDVLLTRRGDRTGLFVALLRAAQLDADLLLTRSGGASSVAPPYPDPYDYPVRLVRVRSNGKVRYARLDSDDTWLGRLPPHFRGGRYLVVGTPRTQPQFFSDADIGRWGIETSVELTVNETGTARGHLILHLPAPQAGGLKAFFAQATPDQVTRQMQGWVSGIVPGAQLTGFTPRGVEDVLGPLELDAEVTIEHFMVQDGGHLIAEHLLGGPIGLETLRVPTLANYLTAPKRESAVLLRPALERLEVTLTLPPSARKPAEHPKSFRHKLPFGHYEQGFSWNPKTKTARLLYHHETPLLRVTKDQMAPFRQAAQAILQMTANRLIVPLGEPGPDRLRSARP